MITQFNSKYDVYTLDVKQKPRLTFVTNHNSQEENRMQSIPLFDTRRTLKVFDKEIALSYVSLKTVLQVKCSLDT